MLLIDLPYYVTGPSLTLEKKIICLSLLLSLGLFGPSLFGHGPVWARARLGPGPFGPKPTWPRAIWAPGPLCPGHFGLGPFPFRNQFQEMDALPVPMPIRMPGPTPLPMLLAYEGP